MTDVVTLLASTKTILLIDWPSRDVPDALARSGFTVTSNDGPGEYNAYEVQVGEVRVRDGTKAVWIQSGRDQTGAKDPRGCWLPETESAKAREIVERAGLTYIEALYIADAARGRG